MDLLGGAGGGGGAADICCSSGNSSGSGSFCRDGNLGGGAGGAEVTATVGAALRGGGAGGPGLNAGETEFLVKSRIRTYLAGGAGELRLGKGGGAGLLLAPEVGLGAGHRCVQVSCYSKRTR